MKHHFRIFAVTAIVSFGAALSACSGGGGDAGIASLGPVEGGIGIPAAKCLGTVGPFDTAQSAISSGLGNLATSLPQGANVAGMLASAVSHLLDSPDALLAALQNLAANHDPQAFAAELLAAGDGLRCGLAYTDAALVNLTQQLQNMSASVPALPGVLGQIKGIETLLGQSLTGAIDLSTLSAMLAALPGPLSQLNAQLPAGLNTPNLRLPLTMVGTISSTVALMLYSIAHLDAATAQGAITGLAVQLATLVNGGAALGLASGVTGLIYAALMSGNTDFLTNLAPYLSPLFTALTRVLQTQPNPVALMQQILMGGISGVPVTTGPFASLLALLSGGGTSGAGLPIPLLSELLALLIPGGLLTP